MDKFDAMQMFVRVIEKGSFSAVAKERRIGQPAVSKQISALEDELGTELILFAEATDEIATVGDGDDFFAVGAAPSLTTASAISLIRHAEYPAIALIQSCTSRGISELNIP